ncbi:hypothetical protein BASA81_004949 [Batrachochytrium salamandrivorans]|nr:hypothetical protein BASA81_004949 [Batrachochytrium salamandrivorans]
MDEFVDEHHRQHVWEGDAERSWEDLVEDNGRLVHRPAAPALSSLGLDPEYHSLLLYQQAKKNPLASGGGRRWMLRSVYLCIDASAASNNSDFKPNRLKCIVEANKAFAHAYFDENPLSTLGVLCVRKGKVEKLSGLSKSVGPVIDALDLIQHCEGAFGLQNVLEIAKQAFADAVLDHASREVIITASAVNLVDAGDVYLTLAHLPKSIRVSTIHLSGQVEVFKRVCCETKGLFQVATSALNMRELLLREHLTPPQATTAACYIVQMGFPSQTLKDNMGVVAGVGTAKRVAPQPSYVVDRVVQQPFYCPNCQAAVDVIPATCRCCQLQLLSSSHLARSFHHLFPIHTFELVSPQSSAQNRTCFACGADGGKFECLKCHSYFCRTCDELVHDTLFACPGCL